MEAFSVLGIFLPLQRSDLQGCLVHFPTEERKMDQADLWCREAGNINLVEFAAICAAIDKRRVRYVRTEGLLAYGT